VMGTHRRHNLKMKAECDRRVISTGSAGGIDRTSCSELTSICLQLAHFIDQSLATMTETNTFTWIASGDRSHPHLKVIDEELKDQLTYPGHQADLERLEGAHLKGSDYEFDDLLFYVRESQRIHCGDRSHPRLVQLDALRDLLTYNGCEEDLNDALAKHKASKDDTLYQFKRSLEKMKRKQSMSVGDHSHEDLKFLDSLLVSFPGWEEELEQALKDHRNGVNIDYYKFSLPERQRMCEGDRSHPRLVALDALTLTYPGWQEDIETAETKHLSQWEFLIHCSDGIYTAYQSYLDLLSSKQRAYETSADTPFLHPIQRQILEKSWSYTGFEDDLQRIRSEDSSGSRSDFAFGQWLEKCNMRQMLNDDNFHDHPALIALNELQLSYPGWQTDVDDAKKQLWNGFLSWELLWDNRIKGMKNKQSIFDSAKKEAAEVDSISDSELSSTKQAHLGSCVICFEASRTQIFVPCGHACVCKSCSLMVMRRNKRCPICNKSATLAMEVFVP